MSASTWVSPISIRGASTLLLPVPKVSADLTSTSLFPRVGLPSYGDPKLTGAAIRQVSPLPQGSQPHKAVSIAILVLISSSLV